MNLYRMRCAFWLWWEMRWKASPLWCWNYSKCFERDQRGDDDAREDVRTEISYMEP